MQVYASNIQQPWPNGADPSLKTLLLIACALYSQQMFMNPFKYTFSSSNDASTSASPILGAQSIGPSHTTQSAMPSSPASALAHWPCCHTLLWSFTAVRWPQGRETTQAPVPGQQYTDSRLCLGASCLKSQGWRKPSHHHIYFELCSHEPATKSLQTWCERRVARTNNTHECHESSLPKQQQA